MTKRYSISEARDNFTTVVQEAEEGIQVELTRGGKPVAILVRAEDLQPLPQGKPSFREAYERFRREHDLTDIDPDEIFGDVRDPSPGRDFNW